MNAIFGICAADEDAAEGALEPDELTQMGDALRFWSTYPPQIWQQGSAGMGVVPCPVDERIDRPLIHEADAGLTLVVSARLINRDELSDALPIGAAYTDAQVILAAWRHWGQACVHYLEGDWHFALWDAQQRCLFLARDHRGSSSLYYCHRAGCFAFASTQKALLALRRFPQRPNLSRMVRILTGKLGNDYGTGYVDIQRLPPAHCLTVDAHGLHITRHWHPEDLPERRLDEESGMEEFLHLYRRAVTRRLPAVGKTGVMLSGGLDSGSLTVLAAAELTTRSQPLYAFTSVPATQPPQTDRRPHDEGPLAAAVAQMAGNTHHTRIDAGDVSPLAGIQRMLSIHDEPIYPASNSYWLWAIYNEAQAQGITTLLVGTAGNDTVSWGGTPPDLSHLLLTGQVESVVDAWRQMGLPLVTTLWIGLGKPWLRRVRKQLTALTHTLTPDPPLMLPLHWEFAHHPLVVDILNEDRAQSPATPEHRLWAKWRLGEPSYWLPPTFHFEDGGAFQMNVFDPTGDRRLVEFCLALSATHYHNGRQNRRLIRRAMAGRLPDQVRLMQTRARQSADLPLRVYAYASELLAMTTSLAGHPLASEVLDTSQMMAATRQIIERPAAATYLTTVALLRGLMVGIFLARF